jgi:hypothetical protein
MALSVLQNSSKDKQNRIIMEKTGSGWGKGMEEPGEVVFALIVKEPASGCMCARGGGAHSPSH